MRIRCVLCGKAVSTEVPDDTVVRAAVECPECLERGEAHPACHGACPELKALQEKVGGLETELRRARDDGK